MKGAAGKVKTFYEKAPEDLEKINTLGSEKNGWKPLQVACGYGAAGVVEVLLGLGAKADVVDNAGMTALHAAADTDEKSIMSMLLATPEGKAAIDAQDSVRCCEILDFCRVSLRLPPA